MRKFYLALLLWALEAGLYSSISGAAPRVQLYNIVGGFVFVVVAGSLLWVLPLGTRSRFLCVMITVLLLASYGTWWISQREYIVQPWMYFAFFSLSGAFFAAIFGALLIGVTLLDRLLERIVSFKTRPPAS